MPGVLAALGAVLLVVFWSGLETSAVEHLVLPRYETAYGFRGGRVPVQRGSERHTVYGFVAVTPGGRLDRAGVLRGDVPSLPELRAALSNAENGQTGSFTVVRAEDWPSTTHGRPIAVAAWARGARPT